MTLRKLSAGDGYTYLTRQVASGDERRAGRSLADYYAASGNPPGRWLGAGAVELGVAGVVSETQMRALFGRGEHPDAEARVRAALAGADLATARRAGRLGRPFPTPTTTGGPVQWWRPATTSWPAPTATSTTANLPRRGQFRLARQATLDTRQGKPPARRFAG